MTTTTTVTTTMTETTTIPTTTTTLFEGQRDEGTGRETRAAARDADALRAPGMLFFLSFLLILHILKVNYNLI